MKKAGLSDAMGLIESVYPGAAAAGLRDVPESTEVVPTRIGEVYTRGTLTLARLGPRGADRRREPDAARCCETSRAAASRRACSTRRAARSDPRTCRARR